MASFNNQAEVSSATKLLVLPITGGSGSEPANKKQKKEAQRRVQHVGVQGPFIKSKWSHIPITFSQEDLQLKDYPHNDAMVISCVIKGFLVHNVLVDTGSAADIIFAKAFRQMQEPEDKIHDATHPLCGFGGRQITALGKITMPVTFGFVHNTRTEQVVFDIVDMEYPYNAIIGRGTLNAFEAILHPAYLCMKIPSEQGPIAVHGSQEAARKAEGNWTDSKAIHNIDGAKVCEQYKYKREKATSADQPKPMLLCEDIVEQKVLLGSQLSEEQEKTLIRFLFNNKDIFAWSANDLCGVNRDVIEHSLNVDPSFRQRKQRLRKMSDDKAEGARNEVKRLLSAGVIGEVKYLEWLANTVMVKKTNGKWRMCIDFTDLNKACPKDEFPLPRIDSLVDAAASSELMSLLDCYSGYHQIWMKKEDEPKTSFITPSGTYCYLRMPEGLKNDGESLSRMIAKVIHSHIGRNRDENGFGIFRYSGNRFRNFSIGFIGNGIFRKRNRFSEFSIGTGIGIGVVFYRPFPSVTVFCRKLPDLCFGIFRNCVLEFFRIVSEIFGIFQHVIFHIDCTSLDKDYLFFFVFLDALRFFLG
jgi:hypothetical protein